MEHANKYNKKIHTYIHTYIAYIHICRTTNATNLETKNRKNFQAATTVLHVSTD